MIWIESRMNGDWLYAAMARVGWAWVRREGKVTEVKCEQNLLGTEKS